MKRWTENEIQTLRENYNKISNTALLTILPGKSANAIYKKAYRLGLRKSPEIEFINRSESRKGEKAANWHGGTSKTSKGYKQVLCPGHHRADSRGYVMEHILVWERESGTQLAHNCCIHHLNGVKDDNRIENLCVMLHNAHTKYHHTGSKRTRETREKISEARRKRIA